MAGYSRVFNRSTNDVIEAADFNTEYQSIEDAFVVASGHKHDGTAGEGSYVPTISGVSNQNAIEVNEAGNEINFFISVAAAKVGQVDIIDGAIVPVVDDDIDLGTALLEFKDAYFDGTVNADSLVADTADINGGTLDNVIIGGATPLAGTFTSITASGTSTLNGNVILGDTVSDNITVNGYFIGDLLPDLDGTYDLGASGREWQDLWIDGTANIDTLAGTTLSGTFAGSPTFSGTVTFSSTVSFQGNVDLGNATGDTITTTGRFDSDLVPSTDSARDLGTSSLQWAEAHIDSGFIDNLEAPTINNSIFTGSIDEEVYTATGGSVTLDPANGTIWNYTMNAATTFTDGLSEGEYVSLHLNGGDVYTATWPTITWIGTAGVAPTLTANDVLVLWKISTTLYGAFIGSQT